MLRSKQIYLNEANIMFRLFHNTQNTIQNTLTEYSNHYIDWSRVSELLRSSTHKYSKEQLIARGFIAGCTAVSGFLGAYYNDEETTHYSSLKMAMAAAFLGFTVSHAMVISPLIYKRYVMSQECNALKNTIEELSKHDIFKSCKDNINSHLVAILELSLSEGKHSRASETWGKRKNLLNKMIEELKSNLESNTDNHEFWSQNTQDLISNLNKNRCTSGLRFK
jgi:hypothetical protein